MAELVTIYCVHFPKFYAPIICYLRLYRQQMNCIIVCWRKICVHFCILNSGRFIIIKYFITSLRPIRDIVILINRTMPLYIEIIKSKLAQYLLQHAWLLSFSCSSWTCLLVGSISFKKHVKAFVLLKEEKSIRRREEINYYCFEQLCLLNLRCYVLLVSQVPTEYTNTIFW